MTHTHTHTHTQIQSVGLLWTRDRPVAKTSPEFTWKDNTTSKTVGDPIKIGIAKPTLSFACYFLRVLIFMSIRYICQ